MATMRATASSAPAVGVPNFVKGAMGRSILHRAAASQPAGARMPSRLIRAADSRRGGNVMDKPSKTLPDVDKSLQRSRKRPPIYKVMLHNDSYNKRDYVVQVLIKVVDGMTMDDAVIVMQEAHDEGMALVIACSQEEAEHYCETLRLNGLTSTLEPGC